MVLPALGLHFAYYLAVSIVCDNVLTLGSYFLFQNQSTWALEFCVNGNLDGLGRTLQMYLCYIFANCMILAGLASVTCLTMCTGGDVNENGVDGLVGCNFFGGIQFSILKFRSIFELTINERPFEVRLKSKN